MTLVNDTPADTIAKCGDNYLADLSMFKPRDVDVSRAAAKAAFEAFGFGASVREPRADTVLKRATREGRKPKGYDVKEFVRPNKDTALAFGVYRIDPITGETGDEHSCVARVRLEKRYNVDAQQEETLAVARPPEGKAECSDPIAWRRANEIAAHANHLLLNVQNTDLGNAIRDAAKAIGAAKTLGGGNNYVVPPAIAQRWHDFMVDLNRIGIWSGRIPLLKDSPASATMVCESAKASLEADLRDLKERLRAAIGKQDATRGRTASLTKQTELAEALREKGRLYMELLGDQISELQSLIDTFNGHFNALLNGDKLPAMVADTFKDYLGDAPVDVAEDAPEAVAVATEEKGGEDW
jgi:hypothetical protein